MDNHCDPAGGQLPPQQYGRPVRRTNGLAVAAVVMAVFALCTILTGIFPIFFGSLSILFAILSRGGEKKLKGGALASSLLSGVSILIGLGITVYSLWALKYDPATRKAVDQAFVNMYGVNYNEFMKEMQDYYETGEMPEFMEELEKGPGGGFLYPEGMDL